jgi:hypothetical protein
VCKVTAALPSSMRCLFCALFVVACVAAKDMQSLTPLVRPDRCLLCLQCILVGVVLPGAPRGPTASLAGRGTNEHQHRL